jgi:sulfatase maturation enzyme AslB (radical SAM superfamily)
VQAMPTRLEIILTNWCNLKCIMCPPSRYAGNYTLPLPRLFEQIDTVMPYLERVGWQGGEFMHLRPVREYIASLKANPNLRNVVTTNGQLLSEEWIRLFLGMNSWLQFSIDSPRRETYEHIRRGGDYDKLVANLRRINEIEDEERRTLGRAVHVAVMRSNLGHLDEFVPFIEEFRFRDVSFMPIVDFPAAAKKAEECIFNDPDLDYGALNALRDRLREGCERLDVAFHWNLPSQPPRRESAPGGMDLGCTHPWEGMWICADRQGGIYPTCGSQFLLGDLNRDSILDVWNGPRMQEYRRKRHDYVCSLGSVA